MSKKYLVVSSLIGLMMLVGAGCGGTNSDNQPREEKKETAAEQKGGGLLNPKGDINVALTPNDRNNVIADAKEIATSVFGNDVKLTGVMNLDIVAKGSISVGYSTSAATLASQYDALATAFRRAGYTILDSQLPVATNEDKSGGVAGKKGTVVLFVTFEPGTKEVGFTAMTNDQYVYLLNTDDEGNPKQ